MMLALTVAACGAQGTPEPGSSADSEPEPDAAEVAGPWAGTWVLRYDASVGGPDGDKLAAVYLAIDPATGNLTRTELPGSKRGNASGPTRVLLVDASHERALRDTRPTKSERAAGELTLYSLVSKDKTSVDLGRVRPDYAAFDAEVPGRLWVVDRTAQLFRVDVGEGKPQIQNEGYLPVTDSWIFTGRFDKNSGKPFVESIDSFETLPPGNGELDKRPIERQGGRLLLTSGTRFKGLPAPKCGPVTGFSDAANGAAAWCVNDKGEVSFLRLDGDGWVRGEPIRGAVENNLVELVFSLPPAEAS